jgi:hypothetical protein
MCCDSISIGFFPTPSRRAPRPDGGHGSAFGEEITIPLPDLFRLQLPAAVPLWYDPPPAPPAAVVGLWLGEVHAHFLELWEVGLYPETRRNGSAEQGR